MDLLELAEYVTRKSTGPTDKSLVKFKPVTDESIANFRDLLSIFENSNTAVSGTDDYKEFYDYCGLLKTCIPDNEKEDLFYTMKLGYYFEGVPSRLVYMLTKALYRYNTPNVAISAIDQRVLVYYVDNNLLPEGLCVKDVVTSILGYDFNIVTKTNPKVKYKDCYEVYIEDADRIAVLTEDIGNIFDNREDIANIKYDPQIGLVFNGIPLRIMNGHLGILSNDFDLRTLYECRK